MHGHIFRHQLSGQHPDLAPPTERYGTCPAYVVGQVHGCAEISAFPECARPTNPSDAVASVNDLASSIYRCQTVVSWIRWQ
jgi:hypothetical protein